MIKEKYPDLNWSLNKHGQQYPIHRCKFGIIDGYKRFESIVGTEPTPKDKGPRFIDHPEIETIEQYVELLKATQPVIMTAEERRSYIRRRGKELKKLGISAEEVVSILKRLTGASRATVYRNLPDDVKQEYGNVSIETLGRKKDISLVPHPGEFLSFFAGKPIWAKVYGKLEKKLFEEFTNAIEDHARGIRLDKGKALTNADLSELLEVTYARLEKSEFSGLNGDSIRWWKFLSEEYSKRYGKDDSTLEQ